MCISSVPIVDAETLNGHTTYAMDWLLSKAIFNAVNVGQSLVITKKLSRLCNRN